MGETWNGLCNPPFVYGQGARWMGEYDNRWEVGEDMQPMSWEGQRGRWGDVLVGRKREDPSAPRTSSSQHHAYHHDVGRCAKPLHACGGRPAAGGFAKGMMNGCPHESEQGEKRRSQQTHRQGKVRSCAARVCRRRGVDPLGSPDARGHSTEEWSSGQSESGSGWEAKVVQLPISRDWLLILLKWLFNFSAENKS